jgi:hypothetical protein
LINQTSAAQTSTTTSIRTIELSMAKTPFWRRSAPDRWVNGQRITPRILYTPCEAEGCDQFGSWGYKVNLGLGEVGHWFCFAHRDQGERLYQSSTHAAHNEPHDHEQPPVDKPFDDA